LLGCDRHLAFFFRKHFPIVRHFCLFKYFNSHIVLRFIGPFLKTVQKWERTLALISDIIDEWTVTQRKWLYLEGIFVGGDIRSQLPGEAKKFDDIDRTFLKIMEECAGDPRIVNVCTVENRLVQFQKLSLGLDNCQKSLNEYLDSKRRIFPR
jgi:dynein heavy chain, axonemal